MPAAHFLRCTLLLWALMGPTPTPQPTALQPQSLSSRVDPARPGMLPSKAGPRADARTARLQSSASLTPASHGEASTS